MIAIFWRRKYKNVRIYIGIELEKKYQAAARARKRHMEFLTCFAGWHQRTRKASNDDGELVAGMVVSVEAGEAAKMIEARARQRLSAC